MKKPVDRLFVFYGIVVMVLALLLFATIFGHVATPCEYSGWQSLLVMVGSWGALAKGWDFLTKGLGLPKWPSTP